jgi:two-component system, chemotaxis family, chemotaxis protein CheY
MANKKIKILVVEDDAVSRKLMMAFVGQLGNCDAACNGLEAVEYFEKSLKEDKFYDLIFMDIMMPEMDGHKAVKQIREIEKKYFVAPKKTVKIIMTSTHSDAKNILKSINEMADAYIIKPLNREKILEEVEKLGLL